MFGSGTRLPASAHASMPWRIHEVADDFRLLDVWPLPTPGGPDDFPRLVRLVTTYDPTQGSFPLRFLFAARKILGELFGLDRPQTGLGHRVQTLRRRLPPELLHTSTDAEPGGLAFTPLYVTDDEWALEIANQTVHGVLHVGWVPNETGGFGGQMAVLVRPNGVLGHLYLAAISPFRHVIVYPTMIRDIGRAWRAEVPR
jgi:Protein of unknown function (DUF2867)